MWSTIIGNQRSITVICSTLFMAETLKTANKCAPPFNIWDLLL